MAFLDGHKESTARGTDLPRCLHFQLNVHSVVLHILWKGRNGKHFAHRGWSPKIDFVGGRDRAGRFVQALVVHQGHGSCPIAVTVEQRSDDTTVDHTWERLVVGFGHELQLQTTLDAVGIDFQAVFIGWSTAITNGRWCIRSLNAVLAHAVAEVQSIDGSSL